jgi:acylphosphatase
MVRLFSFCHPMIRATCFLTGRVQGVGMRFAVREVARSFPVTGTVENLSDGRVRIVVEGDSTSIDAFLAQLQVVAPGHIRSLERFDCEASGEFVNFSIRR